MPAARRSLPLVGSPLSAPPYPPPTHTHNPTLATAQTPLNPPPTQNKQFWGKSIELTLAGHTRLHLAARGETYVWNRPKVHVNDVILGALGGGDVCVWGGTAGLAGLAGWLA